MIPINRCFSYLLSPLKNPPIRLQLQHSQSILKNQPLSTKGDMECKYWLDVENFTIEESFSYNMNNKDKREVKKIIFEYFEFIENEWKKFQETIKQ